MVGKSLNKVQHIWGEVGVGGLDVGSKANKRLLVCPKRGVMGDGADT